MPLFSGKATNVVRYNPSYAGQALRFVLLLCTVRPLLRWIHLQKCV